VDFQFPPLPEGAAWRMVRHILRMAGIVAVSFGLVYGMIWWSSSALRSSNDRLAGKAVAGWQVTGTVRNSLNRLPIPWAHIEDDPRGLPPLHAADADLNGSYVFDTTPDKHNVIVSAPGYRPTRTQVGRPWYLWLPRGSETLNVVLIPE
jgi:hypothetical protein